MMECGNPLYNGEGGNIMTKETVGIYSHPHSTDTYYIMHIPYEDTDKYLKFSPEVQRNLRNIIDMAYKKKVPDGTQLDYRDYLSE